MRVGVAIKLESIRRIKHPFIAIGAGQQGHDQLASGNGLSGYLNILSGTPNRGGKWRIEAQCFLNKVAC